MIHKRSFMGDDICEFSSKHKHPRTLEHFDHLNTVLELEGAYEQWQTLGCTSGEDQDIRSSASDSVTASSNAADKDTESGNSSCFHQCWWDDSVLETDLSLFPEFFDYGQQVETLHRSDEISSPLHPSFQIPVSIGPEYQAIVPDWDFEGLQKRNENHAAESSCQYLDNDYICSEKFLGTCIISMPEVEAPSEYFCRRTEIDCTCPDGGSIRCVKQHITVTRQKLREHLGDGLFESLGFYDMGEDVATKWTEDDEQTFRAIVLSNPAMMGRSFWDHLSATFPSLAKKDLVSYYFNVFMLRKRAEQNRFNPLNIDSDDDEWRGYETGETVKDDDSAIESLAGQDDADPAYCCENHVEDRNIHILENDEDVDFEDTPVKLIKNISGGSVPDNKLDECEDADDSCTTYEQLRDDFNGDTGVDGRHLSRECCD